ncbi:MAG: rod shape-determining protein MreC [Pseudomonadota bacterium]|nr:rod shape-determining protein MreC [Pseudomonadota bacterium]
MVTPRAGWSRRAQYGLFFSLIAAIAGLVIGLLLLAFSIAAPNTFKELRGLALNLTAPLTIPLHEVTATAQGLASGAGDYWDAAGQNGHLKRQNMAMRSQLTTARAILHENRQLKATLQLRERSPQTVAAGRLVGSSYQSPRRFAILSAGTREGVEIGMPVRTAEGLIGRVIDAGAFSARVLLVSDRSNIVPARHLRSGQAIISQGRGDGTVELKPLEVGRNPFRRGDVVITSGTGGLYPPLVPLARVVRLEDDNAIAIPFANPSESTIAIVLEAYEPEAMQLATQRAQDLP